MQHPEPGKNWALALPKEWPCGGFGVFGPVYSTVLTLTLPFLTAVCLEEWEGWEQWS